MQRSAFCGRGSSSHSTRLRADEDEGVEVGAQRCERAWSDLPEPPLTCDSFDLSYAVDESRRRDMSTSTLERTVLPPAESLHELVAMFSRLGAEPATTLSGPNGEHLILPPEVFEVLRDVVEAMADGQAVTIAPVHQRLTTQEAADLLGVSRPTIVKLLETGEIPFEQPGRHRRVRLADVLAYRERSSAERRAALDRMVEIADEADMYERTATPKRTR